MQEWIDLLLNASVSQVSWYVVYRLIGMVCTYTTYTYREINDIKNIQKQKVTTSFFHF